MGADINRELRKMEAERQTSFGALTRTVAIIGGRVYSA